MRVHIYGCLKRPPNPGHVPLEGIYYAVYTDADSEKTPSGKPIWGRVYYTRGLDQTEIDKYWLEQMGEIDV